MARPKITPEERFWSHVDKRGHDECWLWLAGKYVGGYGALRTAYKGRKFVRAPRLAWAIVNGPIPAGLWVLHRCDNPPCVNPAHLFLGTHKDNMRDREAKGRNVMSRHPECSSLWGPRKPEYQVRGTRCHQAKLDEVKVVELRRKYMAGEPFCRLAREYGVAAWTIQKAVMGRTWAHVPIEHKR